MISLKHFILRTNTKHSTSHVKHRHTKGAIQEMLSRSCRYGCIALPTVLTSGTLASTWLPLLHFAPAKYDRSWRESHNSQRCQAQIRKNPHFSQVFHAVLVALGEMQADLYRFDFEAIWSLPVTFKFQHLKPSARARSWVALSPSSFHSSVVVCCLAKHLNLDLHHSLRIFVHF